MKTQNEVAEQINAHIKVVIDLWGMDEEAGHELFQRSKIALYAARARRHMLKKAPHADPEIIASER